MLLGGLALGVFGIAAAMWRAFPAIARERIAAAVAIPLVLLLGGSVNGTVLLVTVDLFIATTLAVEHARIEHRRAGPPDQRVCTSVRTNLAELPLPCTARSTRPVAAPRVTVQTSTADHRSEDA